MSLSWGRQGYAAVAVLVGGWITACVGSGCGGESSSEMFNAAGSGGVGAGGAGGAGASPDDNDSIGGIGGAFDPEDMGGTCDPTRSVQSDGPAMVETDPSVLERFPLERVLAQIADSGGGTVTPLALLQRLFDTENTTAQGVFSDNLHCDDPKNPAFLGAPPVDCPRAEGVLATRAGLLTPGDPDSFVPVALVNRFDLTPSNLLTCGEYRIVYAKASGRTDPNDRVFLILEAAFENRRGLAYCRPIVDLWASLDSEADSQKRADLLEQFFFVGTAGLPPAIRAAHYQNTTHCDYSACGQLRIGQGMQSPWQFRQFRLDGFESVVTGFIPIPNSNVPRPEVFDSQDLIGTEFRRMLVPLMGSLTYGFLERRRVEKFSHVDAGESAVAGPGGPNYLERVEQSSDGAVLLDGIAERLTELDIPCPAEDPLTPANVLLRAEASTCAGCHAPSEVLPEGRRIGCGDVWPETLGRTHVDEFGNLSPALRDVFLPDRAQVFTTYLKACDKNAVWQNLLPSDGILPRH